MASYVTDGSCCCGGQPVCCPTDTYCNTNCIADDLFAYMPTGFADYCACWDGRTIPFEKDPGCVWTTNPLLIFDSCPGWSGDAVDVSASVVCAGCIWILTIDIATAGETPACTQLHLVAWAPALGDCPPSGLWTIMSMVYSRDEVVPGCSPCDEVFFTQIEVEFA